MAGLPGGGRSPGGVPKFVSAPATRPVGDSTTYIARAPTFVPTWRNWVPPGGTYGFVDYSIGVPPSAPDTTHILRAPTFTPTWQRYRIENLGFAQSVPSTLAPVAAVPVFMPGVIVWSNPRAAQRSVDLLTWTQSLSAPALLPPFAQHDWPNPVRLRPDIVAYWIAGTNLGLLRPDVNPFAQRDWPVPRGAQRGQDLIANTNLGLLRPDVAPFSQDDWPNPRGAQRGQDFVASTNLGLLRPDVNPFIPHDWANPRLALQPVADWLAQGIRAAVQAPFAQFAWPNPRVSLQRQDFNAGINLGLLRPDVNAFSQDDWQNPVGPSLRHVGYHGWIDYSMQPAAVVTPPDTTHILRAPLYTPRWQPYLTVNFDWSQSVTALNLPPTVSVAVESRTPTFTPTWQKWQARSYVSWADYYSIQVIPPPTNYDWLNPRIASDRGHVGYQGWLQSATALNLLPAVVVTYEPRAPTFYKYTPQSNRFDWVQGTTLTLRPAGVVQAPPLPIDWPNPRGLLPANAGFAAAINLGLLRPGVNPEINYDWPNPQRARQPVADWIQSAFIALQTSPPPPQPFNQTDWPVPRGAVGVHVGSTSATQLGLLRPDINPFLPRDFANPRAPLRSIDLYGWICALSALNLPVPVKPPIAQYDWPNPPAPVRGIDLWGWSQPVTVLNLPPTIIPPPEVLQPGGRGVPHTFSRKKWRELQMLIAAEMAAVAKAEELTKRDKREALLAAARAAAAAVDAAEAEGENKRLDKLLVRNALTLRAAIRAASEVKLLRETASAIEQSRAIVQRQQDEEDEMINLLMLS